ncbi:MAG TPA: response regulator [Gaiellaceae bacterium]|nr:response regulator [Gaiellaceae bacterium]
MPPLRCDRRRAPAVRRDPRLDGVHATRLLRRLLPACPVVVLTASLSPEDAHRARTAGAAGYLTKGCSAEHVVGALLEVGTSVPQAALQ